MMEKQEMAMFPAAPQPEIILSSTKDDYYVSELSTHLRDALENIWGNANGSQLLEPELQVLSKLTYYIATGRHFRENRKI